MAVSVNIYQGQKPTQQQAEEIRIAASRTPLYDEEAPELSLEQLKQYRQAAIRKRGYPPQLRLSERTDDQTHR